MQVDGSYFRLKAVAHAEQKSPRLSLSAHSVLNIHRRSYRTYNLHVSISLHRPNWFKKCYKTFICQMQSTSPIRAWISFLDVV